MKTKRALEGERCFPNGTAVFRVWLGFCSHEFLLVGESISGLREALGTGSPEDHFRLIDVESRILRCMETRPCTNHAIHVDRLAAAATDEVVVIVRHPILVECGGPCRLDAPDQSFVNKHPQRVIHGLPGNRPDIAPHLLGNGLRRGVRTRRHRPENRQPLSGHWHANFSEERFWIRHAPLLIQDLDSVKI